MNYVLESDLEFDRLERQSQNQAYNFMSELKEFQAQLGLSILDAGCGSGIVSRYLAKSFPGSKVIGCDLSLDRVSKAIEASKDLHNLAFEKQDLTQLTFGPSSFDSIICRYVIEHLNQSSAKKMLNEFNRCIRPGGSICVIDMDGFLFNLFPQTQQLTKWLKKIEKSDIVDLNVGRKIPQYLAQAGFESISWRIETLQFQGDALETEAKMLEERFEQATPIFEQLLGGKSEAATFKKEYLASVRSPNAVLFYNKFVATGKKKGLQISR